MPCAPSERTQTTPGSIAHRIADAARTATEAAGRPLTAAQLRADYVARYGALESLHAVQFHALARRGILVAAAGRAGRTAYVHRDSALRATVAMDSDDAPHAEDDAVRVLRALTECAQQAGRPVSTREVGQTLHDLGVRLETADVNGVLVRLRTLARPRPGPGRTKGAPRVLRIDATTVRGRPTLRWWPAHLPLPRVVPDHALASSVQPHLQATAMALVPATQADALRGAVRQVQRHLGRPVTRAELSWWLAAHPAEPVAAPLRDAHVQELLSGVAHADRAQAVVPGMLIRVPTPFACPGGTRASYWVLEPEETVNRAAMQVALVRDLAVGLRLADEASALATLTQRADRLRLPALAHLADVRGEAVAQMLADHLGEGTEGTDLDAAIDAALASLTRTATWAMCDAKDRDTHAERLREVRDTGEQVLALRAWRRTPVGVTRWTVVGAQSAVALPSLYPLLDAAAREFGAPRLVVQRAALRHARRVRRVAVGASRFGSPTTRGDVGVDRVDALLGIYALVPTPRTHAMLDAAKELLGPVLRDPRPLHRLLAEARTHSRAIMRSAAVALALLSDDRAAHDLSDVLSALAAGDAADQRAVVLATMLMGRMQLQHLSSGAVMLGDRVADLAWRRAAAGRVLTALG